MSDYSTFTDYKVWVGTTADGYQARVMAGSLEDAMTAAGGDGAILVPESSVEPE